jgi:hypothetical protein
MLGALVAAAALASGQDVPATPPGTPAPPASLTPGPDTTPPTPAPGAASQDSGSAAAPASGVIRYDPSYFADQRPNTAYDMVARLPGFTFDGGATVRGFAGAAGNVLIDGDRPTTKQDNLQSILQRVPAGQVDHIDVIRGGASGIDMQGRTVIANVVRKKAGGVSGVLSVADQFVYDGRTGPQMRAEFRKKWSDGRSFELAGLYASYFDDGLGDGPRVRTDAAGNVLERADVETRGDGKQATVNSAYETPALGGKFRINGSLLVDHFDDRVEDTLLEPLPQAGFLTLTREEQDRMTGEVGLHFERDLNARTGLETLFIQQYSTQDYASIQNELGAQTLFTESDTSGETIGRAIVRYRHSDTLQAEAAVEGAYNFLEAQTDFSLNGAPIPLPAANVRVEEKRGEASAKATWRPGPKWQVEAGMRVEISTISSSGDVVLEKTLTYPKPRVVLTWSPSETNQFRLRLEREVGQLDFRDFVANSALSEGDGTVRSGNPDLVPQRAWVGEVAYEHRFWGSGAATLTLRHSEIQDATDRIPLCALDAAGDCAGDFFDAPGNIGDGRETDVQLDLTLPLDKLGLRHALIKGAGTWRRSEVTDPTTGESRRISGQHPFDYELHFSHDIPRWRINWGVDVYNRWTQTYYRFNEVDRYALKTFMVLFAEWKPRPDLSLRTEWSNIGFRGYQQTFTVYDGIRHGQPPAFIDDRQLDVGPTIYVRVRKTFG